MPKITRHGGPTGVPAELIGGNVDAAEVPAFDPADHNVDEVVAFLEEYPEAVEAVKTSEAEGKARKTILEYEAG